MLRIRGNQLSLLAALSAHWAHQQLAISLAPDPRTPGAGLGIRRLHRLGSDTCRGPLA